MVLESCVETFGEAINAWKLGANRLELCSHLEMDGLTPAPELTRKVCKAVPIPVMVMIRPRAGNFVFTSGEIRLMAAQIAEAKAMGASGIVLGLLTNEGEIDLEATGSLAKLAAPLPVTFHKAIDTMADPVKAIRVLKNVEGVSRVLTSGGKATAKEGYQTIQEMIQEGSGKITIIAAGKVTLHNYIEIGTLTGATELHGRRIVGDLQTHSS